MSGLASVLTDFALLWCIFLLRYRINHHEARIAELENRP